MSRRSIPKTDRNWKFSLIVLLFFTSPSFSENYPDMVGVWTGDVRVVQAGGAQVAKGGMEISQVNIKVTIDHQDEESFMGRSRTSQMSNNDPSVNVWGTIRSTGKEAIFITSNGARGQMWLKNDHQTFEFCITNLVDGQATAYCADLSKARD